MANLRLALMLGITILSATTIIQLLVIYTLQTTWYEEVDCLRDRFVKDRDRGDPSTLSLKIRGAQQGITNSTVTVDAVGTVQSIPSSNPDQASGAEGTIESHENQSDALHGMTSNVTINQGSGAKENIDSHQNQTQRRMNSTSMEAPKSKKGKTSASNSSVVYAKPGEYFPDSLQYRNQPVNPHPYRFTINKQNLCKNETGGEEDVFLLVQVISAPGHFKHRMRIRETYMQETEVSGRKIKQLFLLGTTNNSRLNRDIFTESSRHRDMARENFADSYRNLTLKYVMSLKWASTYCPQATWVLKIDDDVLVDLNKLVPYLMGLPDLMGLRHPENMIMGQMLYNTKPLRWTHLKWYVLPEEYAHDFYPTYPFGAAYVTSGELIPKLYNESLYVPYFWIDDVYAGILANRLGVDWRHVIRFRIGNFQFTERVIRRAFTLHAPNISAAKWKKMWRRMTKNEEGEEEEQ